MDKTLLKGLAVLEALAEAAGETRTVQEVASNLGMTKSNAHRTLQTLAHAGYIERDVTSGSYRTTLKLFELGIRQLARVDIRQSAAPSMRTLADATAETVHLSVLDGCDVLYVDKIESPQPVRAYSMIGGRAPAYCVATGKVLLAYQDDDYFERHPIEITRHTAKTVADTDALRAELDKVVAAGYAFNRGEWRATVGGVAAPIFDGFGAVVAAVGISGPLERLTQKRMRAFVPAVLEAAAEISANLGYKTD